MKSLLVGKSHTNGARTQRAARDSWKQYFHGYLYLTSQLLRGRPVGPFIRRLQEWERLDRPTFQHLISERLKETLRYARERVPLYSSGPWQGAFSHSDPSHIHSWPVLERQMLRTHSAELLARARIPGLFYRQSSASTGEPVRVALNPHAAGWSWANEYRAMLWHGIAPGTKTLMLWGHSNPVLDWVRNRKVFLTTDFTPALLEEVGRTLLRRRPALCWGHPSAIAQLARYVRAHYPEVPQPLVPYAKVGGEQLFPFQREEIEKSLGARVIESYGCTEVGAIAAECAAGSLHIFAEHVHVEIFQHEELAEPGEFGDIVATSLTNRAMPLVRCRIGDRGRLSLEPCPCGLPHPVLKDLEGRVTDFFLASDGSKVHGSVLGHSLQPILASTSWEALHQVLFQQIDQQNWKVFVESGSGFQESHALHLSQIIRKVFGEHTQVEIERVSVIPREKSGKFRYYRLTRNQESANQIAGKVAIDETAAKRGQAQSRFSPGTVNSLV